MSGTCHCKCGWTCAGKVRHTEWFTIKHKNYFLPCTPLGVRTLRLPHNSVAYIHQLISSAFVLNQEQHRPQLNLSIPMETFSKLTAKMWSMSNSPICLPQCHHKDHPTPQIWPQIPQCQIFLIHMDLNLMHSITNSSGSNNYDDDSFSFKQGFLLLISYWASRSCLSYILTALNIFNSMLIWHNFL